MGAQRDQSLSSDGHRSGRKTALSGVGVETATRPLLHSRPLGKTQQSSVALELPGSQTKRKPYYPAGSQHPEASASTIPKSLMETQV